MSTRRKRKIVRGKKAIRGLIEDNGMKYVMMNNGIFDELFCKEGLAGITGVNLAKDENDKLIKQNGEKTYVASIGSTRFSQLDLITYVFLQFMMINNITLSHKELAGYIGCSEKQLKLIIHRLRDFEAPCNARYQSYKDQVVLVEEEKKVKLITEKAHKAYDPTIMKTRRVLHWYTNYIPNHQIKKDNVVPVDFFIVTIDDFDLLTKGVLTRNEFIVYLFLLRIYKSGAVDDRQVYWRYSTIAEKLNIKMVENVQKYIQKLMSVEVEGKPLIKELKPKNYEMQIEKGEEPSAKFIPVFNPEKLVEMDSLKMEVDSSKKEMDSDKVEVNFEKKEMNFPNLEVNSLKKEVNSNKKEIDSKFSEMDFLEMEMEFLNKEMD
ncbi:MAG: hypothetical protein LPK00_13155 [Bacillaceae bacterium]|nr:hypothetical protein [Bacillaceae bacterium]